MSETNDDVKKKFLKKINDSQADFNFNIYDFGQQEFNLDEYGTEKVVKELLVSGLVVEDHSKDMIQAELPPLILKLTDKGLEFIK